MSLHDVWKDLLLHTVLARLRGFSELARKHHTSFARVPEPFQGESRFTFPFVAGDELEQTMQLYTVSIHVLSISVVASA